MRARWEDIYRCRSLLLPHDVQKTYLCSMGPSSSLVLKFVLFLTNPTQKSTSKPAGMRMDLQPPPQKNSEARQYSIL
ncbi:hypothetical protein BYT27DRAFT_7187495 [Phlegmacium glaucopus]|nr:hypothetical protein BYT27DRAFT_7187495 [Phlegmacium glaucopus]